VQPGRSNLGTAANAYNDNDGFLVARSAELQDVMQKTKQVANQIKEPADVWELELYLTERAKEIDNPYPPLHPPCECQAR
jgi:hypothetical protein